MPLHAVRAASICSGPVSHAMASAAEKEYGGKRQNLLGLHPLCGKKVLPVGYLPGSALDLSADSANNRLR